MTADRENLPPQALRPITEDEYEALVRAAITSEHSGASDDKIVGLVMRKTGGKADPRRVYAMVKEMRPNDR